jgi:hypothetical protein
VPPPELRRLEFDLLGYLNYRTHVTPEEVTLYSQRMNAAYAAPLSASIGATYPLHSPSNMYQTQQHAPDLVYNTPMSYASPATSNQQISFASLNRGTPIVINDQHLAIPFGTPNFGQKERTLTPQSLSMVSNNYATNFMVQRNATMPVFTTDPCAHVTGAPHLTHRSPLPSPILSESPSPAKTGNNTWAPNKIHTHFSHTNPPMKAPRSANPRPGTVPIANTIIRPSSSSPRHHPFQPRPTLSSRQRMAHQGLRLSDNQTPKHRSFPNEAYHEMATELAPEWPIRCMSAKLEKEFLWT